MRHDRDITYFARTNHRGTSTPFGIRRADRRHHMYVVGKTGVGKSTLLKTLILEDLRNGEGLCLLDPHGDLFGKVVAEVPEERKGDLIRLDLPGEGAPWYFNPLSGVSEGKEPLAVAGLLDAFKKIWSDEWGPRLEHLFRNVLYTLLAAPGSSLADVPALLSDASHRRWALSYVRNDVVLSFWRDEFDRYSPAFRAVVTAPLLNKVGAFLTDPRLRSVLESRESSFDLRRIMDQGKVLLVNLGKGSLGEGPAALLGSLLVSSLSLAALSRSDTQEEERRDFYLYLDEFHTFSTLTLATMLSELRKYRLALILAHQYLGQLEHEVKDAVFGNVGTFISFRVGALDAPTIAREFSSAFSADHLAALPNFDIYLKLMVGGEVGRGFSGRLAYLPAASLGS